MPLLDAAAVSAAKSGMGRSERRKKLRTKKRPGRDWTGRYLKLKNCPRRRSIVGKGEFQRLILRIRSDGVMMSVRRIPNLSFTTTTSPWAIRVPLTRTSIGSPAMASSSTTEPCASCSRFLMVILVRPSSTVIWTGMSRIMSSSFRMPLLPLTDPKEGKMLAGWAAAAPLSATTCSAMAAAQSSSLIWSSPAVFSVSSDIFFSQGRFNGLNVRLCGDETFYLERVLTVLLAVRTFDERYLVDHRMNALGNLQGNDIPHFQFEDLPQTELRRSQIRDDFYLRTLQLPAQGADPALVGRDLVTLHRAVEQVADRLHHRVREADVHVCRGAAEFEGEGGRDDNFSRCGDVCELRVHLGADVLEADVVDRLPGLGVLGKHHAEQALNDALLGRREDAAFDAGMEAPVATEHVVHDQENQIRVEDKEGGTAQWLGLNQVQVGRDDQIADEFAVFLNADRADRNFRVAVHVVKEADAQVAGKTLVDEFERGHPPADNPLLRTQIVRTDAFIGAAGLFGVIGLAGDALE